MNLSSLSTLTSTRSFSHSRPLCHVCRSRLSLIAKERRGESHIPFRVESLLTRFLFLFPPLVPLHCCVAAAENDSTNVSRLVSSPHVCRLSVDAAEGESDREVGCVDQRSCRLVCLFSISLRSVLSSHLSLSSLSLCRLQQEGGEKDGNKRVKNALNTERRRDEEPS